MEMKSTHVDTGPLVHHVWTHTKKHAMQVTSLGGVTEDLAPGGLFLVALGCNCIEDFLELTLDFLIVERFVQKAAYGVFRLGVSSAS